MAAFTNDLIAAILEANFTDKTCEMALYEDVPGADGIGVELSGNGYARAAVVFGDPSVGRVASNAAVEFPEASGDWSEALGWGIHDSDTGDMLCYGAFTPSVTIVTGQSLYIPAGAVLVVLT